MIHSSEWCVRRPRPSSCVKRLSRTQHHPLKSLRSLATRWNSCMAYRTCLSRTSMISAMTYSMYHAYCSRMPVTGGRHSNMILPLPSRTVLRSPVYLYNTNPCVSLAEGDPLSVQLRRPNRVIQTPPPGRAIAAVERAQGCSGV